MGTSANTLREQARHYMEHVNDKKKAFYTMFEKDIKEEAESIYTAEFKAELDKRHEGYTSGKTKMITPAESKRRLQKLLKEKFKK